MKLGVAIYYKNIEIYPFEWIKKCITTILNQTYPVYKIYELNYDEKYYNGLIAWSRMFHKPLNNYADAMNFLYNEIFKECDVVANVNIDDYYDERRFELLMQSIQDGAHIASSNYIMFDENRIIKYVDFDEVNIEQELNKGNNVVSNPCHLMRKEVFEKLKFNSALVPKEDLAYWKEAVKYFNIVIRPEYLHYYRVHKNQSGNIC